MSAMNKPMRSVRLAEAVPLSLVTDWLSAHLPQGCGSEMVQGVSTDTRTLQPGDLFIALRGAQFDAHEFLEDVREAGAVAAVVEATSADIARRRFDIFIRYLSKVVHK